MPLFLMAPPAPASRNRQDGEIVISAWMEDLVWQYRAGVPAPPRPRRPQRLMIIVAVLATACVVLSPTLLRHVRAAYPSEPDKQRALEFCSRVDPSFVRFLASERTTCYAHFRELVARPTATSR